MAANNVEKEKEENKVVCLSVFTDETTRHWFSIDPRSESESVPGREIVTIGNYRPRVDKIEGYGIAVVDSKIYHLGGHYWDDDDHLLKEVYIFDTVTGCWSEGPPLNEGRTWPTFVGVIGRKIYVFGTKFYPYKYMNISVENWAECYDLDSKSQQWQVISGPNVNPEHFFSCDTDAVVVYEDQILFWGSKIGIYAYNHQSNLWSFMKEGFTNGGPKPCFNFMSNHAVIGDFAVWQYCGKIYAWDLTNHNTYLIWNLPDRCSWLRPPLDPSEDDWYPDPSYLVHAGDGLLCCLRWRLHVGELSVACYKFQIKGSTRSSGCHLAIDPIGIQYFDVPGVSYIHDAIALSVIFKNHFATDRERQDKQVFNDLPHDVMMNILLRTRTLESIECYRLVCKAWRDLLSSPDIANLHLSTPPSCILLSAPHSNDYKLRHYGLIVSRNVEFSFSSLLSFSKPSAYKLSDDENRVVGSCNGILIWRTSKSNKTTRGMYLSNPLTGEYVFLPRKKLFPTDHIGFGFSPKTNEYKVILLYPQTTYNNDIETWFAFVHTVGTKTWRRIDGEIPNLIPDCEFVYLNGTLNWVAYETPNEPISKCVYSFDVETEKFKRIASLRISHSDIKQLGLFRDRLCICSASWDGITPEIWVLEKEKSWIQIFLEDPWKNIINRKYELSLIGVLENGAIYFDNGIARVKRQLCRKIILHNPKKLYAKELFIKADTVIIAHVPSFVSLKDIVGEDDKRSVIKIRYELSRGK